jgi:hypothetical protein
VYRNGALLGSADYTATNGTTVVLANAASSGDLIETISFYVSSVLNAIPAVNNAVTTAYINDGAVTTAKIADANVTQAKLATGVVGNGPSFSAYQSSSQSINNATETKVNYQTEEWDTASCFDTSNSRFTPTVAGYYQVDARVSFTSGDTRVIINLFKNGSSWKRGNDSGSASVNSGIVSALVYLNGSTDYIDVYAYQARGSANSVSALSTETYFQAAMVRAA